MATRPAGGGVRNRAAKVRKRSGGSVRRKAGKVKGRRGTIRGPKR